MQESYTSKLTVQIPEPNRCGCPQPSPMNGMPLPTMSPRDEMAMHLRQCHISLSNPSFMALMSSPSTADSQGCSLQSFTPSTTSSNSLGAFSATSSTASFVFPNGRSAPFAGDSPSEQALFRPICKSPLDPPMSSPDPDSFGGELGPLPGVPLQQRARTPSAALINRRHFSMRDASPSPSSSVEKGSVPSGNPHFQQFVDSPPQDTDADSPLPLSRSQSASFWHMRGPAAGPASKHVRSSRANGFGQVVSMDATCDGGLLSPPAAFGSFDRSYSHGISVHTRGARSLFEAPRTTTAALSAANGFSWTPRSVAASDVFAWPSSAALDGAASGEAATTNHDFLSDSEDESEGPSDSLTRSCTGLTSENTKGPSPRPDETDDLARLYDRCRTNSVCEGLQRISPSNVTIDNAATSANALPNDGPLSLTRSASTGAARTLFGGCHADSVMNSNAGVAADMDSDDSPALVRSLSFQAGQSSHPRLFSPCPSLPEPGSIYGLANTHTSGASDAQQSAMVPMQSPQRPELKLALSNPPPESGKKRRRPAGPDKGRDSHRPHAELQRHKCKLPIVPPCKDTQGINVIEASVLAGLLSGGPYSPEFDQVIVVDCRFDFEYQGGHIKGAINITSPAELEQFFFDQSRREYSPRTAIVLHCEFSQRRGPASWFHIRQQDRRIHGIENFPSLFYPELYLLKGGYKDFFTSFPDLCAPQAYVPMKDPAYVNELQQCQPAHRRLWKAAKARR